MKKTMGTTIWHYFNHLTCTLFIVLGLMGSFAPMSQAATGAFTFSTASYSVGEGAGNVNITINRGGGSTGAATVQWRTNSTTATFTKDYGDFGLTTLSFAAGETQKIMRIKIVNDTLIEPKETFNVTLSSPTLGTTLGTITSAVVTIQDNDTVAADTTLPTVTLTSPVTATTFTSAQTVTIAATAADNVGVNKVEFYDGATLKATNTTSPYSFAWAITSANNGSHSLTAKAYDVAGNSKVSAAAAVTVNIPVPDLTAPTVSVTSPANGTNYTTPQTVTVAVSAADNIGVSKVELYDGATLKATDTTSPYSFAWAITSANNGSHSLTAKAYDAAGNNKVSAAINVTVNITAAVVTGPVKVFPGAEGFGTASVAGRGGQIIKVTNLNDSGTGSLRAALSATGPRIVVFEVSGTIRLATDLSIQNPYITVAGQTAPSPGISLRGAGIKVVTHDVLVQHLRIRVGDDLAGPTPQNRDALQILGNSAGTSTYNVVIDHVSACWAIDENLSTWYAQHDVTISNSIVSEGLNNSLHPKGAHSKGLLVGDLSKNVALIGNLMAHNVSRNPMIKGGASAVVVNNVSYNADDYDFFGIVDPEGRGPSIVSALSNVFLTGPDTKYGIPAIGGGMTGTKFYQNGNYYTDGKIVSSGLGAYQVSTPPISFSPLTVQSGNLVEAAVLEYVGARPADRDAVDKRIVNEVKTRSGRYVDSPSQVGGWPTLAMNTKSFIVPANPNGDDDDNGYTNVEEILHQMAAMVEGRVSP